MARERIAVRDQEQALATYLWERGPMTAVYQGEMSDKVAKVLAKTLDFTSPPTRTYGTRLIQTMLDHGLVEIVGSRQLTTRLTYIGPDPATVEWVSPTLRLDPPPSDDRLSRLEARLAQVEADLTALRQSLGETL